MTWNPVANDFAMFSPEGGDAVKLAIDDFVVGFTTYEAALQRVAVDYPEVYDTAVRDAIHMYVEAHPARVRRDPLTEVW
jgi:hypothetical protein